jgi:hypothetical protein
MGQNGEEKPELNFKRIVRACLARLSPPLSRAFVQFMDFMLYTARDGSDVKKRGSACSNLKSSKTRCGFILLPFDAVYNASNELTIMIASIITQSDR